MGKLSDLGRAIGERARAAAAEAEAAQASKITTREGRVSRASWGEMCLQAGALLSTIGAHLLGSAYADAETTAGSEYDRGYEQRRADEAEAAAVRVQPGADVEDQAAVDVEHQDQAAAAGPAAAVWVPTIEGGAGPAAAADGA
jgi:hypothetical protein